MGSKRAFDLQPIDQFWPRPAFGRSQDNHGPARPGCVVIIPRVGLDLPNLFDRLFQSGGHELVHLSRIAAFHKERCPAAPSEELLQLLRLDAGQQGWIADFEAVQVQNGKDRAIGHGIEKLVGLPCSRQWSRLCFSVADDAGDDQIGIVERSPERVAERISEFTAFVNRSRRGWRHMAGNSAGKRELLEQLFQPRFVLGDIGIDVGPGAFKVDISRQSPRPPWPLAPAT